jgi:hypothetical protein
MFAHMQKPTDTCNYIANAIFLTIDFECIFDTKAILNEKVLPAKL